MGNKPISDKGGKAGEASGLLDSAGSSALPQGHFFTMLYERYWGELCKYVNSRFGAGPPDPEDVVQQTFVKFAALDDTQNIQNPRAFLYRMARNIVLNHHRDHRRENTGQDDFLNLTQPCDDLTPERVTIGKESITILEKVIRALPRRRQQFFLQHRLQGLSYAEIARRSGVTPSSVKRHVALAMQACLAEVIAQEEDAQNTQDQEEEAK